ncbi:sec-independent protein translocase protein TatA [Mycetocola sp. CAN_C7]|uniref:twin-arginine translocase TatA/TatE family subunit n=1 Tax=Mycetocola sp. CAN_C7 TaxID=2787724 RepID=UPI001A1DDF4C
MGIFGNLTGWHLLVIVFLVLLLFGAPKLPGLAKSVGQSMKIFKAEIKTDKNDKTETTDGPAAAPVVPPANTTTTAPAEQPTIANPANGAPGSQTKP